MAHDVVDLLFSHPNHCPRSLACNQSHNAFSLTGGKRPGKQPVRVVLKKSKAGVAGGDDIRNAEIHMNHRLQVFLLVHVFRVRMLHLSFRDKIGHGRISSHGRALFRQSMYECIFPAILTD